MNEAISFQLHIPVQQRLEKIYNRFSEAKEHCQKIIGIFHESICTSLSSCLGTQSSAVVINRPKDPWFCQTDLLLYPDNWMGQMPLNGIRQNDYQGVVEMIQAIVAGTSKIRINSNDSDKFQQKVLAALIILMTRPVSRKLLEKKNHAERPPPDNSSRGL